MNQEKPTEHGENDVSRNCWKSVLVLLMLSVMTAFAKDHSKQQQKPIPGVKLTGRFVGWMEGPRLTSFGMNYDSLIFAVESGSKTTFITLSYGFMLYEPQIPKSDLAYTTLYTIQAVPDKRCDGTLENMSRRYVFNSQGAFEKVERGVAYTRDLPALELPWNALLPCYSLSPHVVREIQSSTN